MRHRLRVRPGDVPDAQSQAAGDLYVHLQESLSWWFGTVGGAVYLRLPIGGGTVPDDWEALRFRWELGHTLGFVLFAAAFALQVAFVLRDRDRGRVPAPSG